MKRSIFYLSLLYVLGSCSSFKEVKSYATNSGESIKSYKSINYTFSRNCNYKCSRRALENSNFQTLEKKCSCEEALLADKNIKHLLRVLEGYFSGLSNLSDSELTDFSFDAIQKPLTEGKYIKKADIKPYTEISSMITIMFTDGYRAKKLQQFIKISNSDVILLLEKMNSIIEDSLLPTLLARQADIQQIYHDLYSASDASSFEKFNIQKMYFSEITTIEEKKEALEKYSVALGKISKGHQSLYENKHKLKGKEIRKTIRRFANDLNLIVKQIKK